MKKNPKDIQSYTIHVRLTQGEGKELEKIGKKSKKKLATLGREALLEKYPSLQ